LKVHLLLAIGLALGVAFLVAMAVPESPVTADPVCDRWVLGIDASDTSDCSDPAHPCLTVQYAIDQATDGDRICVADHSLAPGPTIYAENILITRTLTLDGKWEAACVDPSNLNCSFTPVVCEPERVVLDAQGMGRTITIRGPITPTVDCFTITGGDAAGLGGDPQPTVDNDAGGGIYSQDAAPLIINSVITGNYGCEICPVSYGRGGGIYLLNAPPSAVLSGNRIENNVADESTWGQGGGLMLRDSFAQVLNNVIQNNRAGHSAGDGGGIAVQGGGPTIAHNDILTNVGGVAVLGNGGGIFTWYTASVTIEDNLIQGNIALDGVSGSGLTSRGGGIYYSGAPGTSAIIRANTVRWNTAGRHDKGQGGGIYLEGLDPTSIVTDNTLIVNFAGETGGDGGGYYVQDSNLTLTGGRIEGNYGSPGGEGRGGGLFLNDSTVMVASAIITNNIAGGIDGFGRGGGAYISNTVTSLVGNQFLGNRAALYEPWPGSGGAVEMHNSPGSLFRANRFDRNRAPVYGGAIFLQASDGVTFQSNTFSRNTALQGGGGYVLYSNGVAFEANTIVDNTSSGGAGIYLYDSAARLDNNVVADNLLTGDGGGAGVWIEGNQALLRHNTIARNRNGSGVQVSSYWGGAGQVVLTNTILVSHTVGISVAVGSAATLEDTLWGAGPWANGQDWGGPGTIFTGTLNYAGDPAFADPASEDYHIGPGSAALDLGVDARVADDIDLQPRPYRAPDLGADEYWPPGTLTYLPLILRNSAR
jgi:putative cofactor-binding repeat protein